MIQKRWTALLMAVALMVCMVGTSALAQETDAFLAQLQGTYDELFTVICAPEYDDVWLAACAEYGDEENAEAYAQMLKAACVGTLYGQDAIDAYGDGEEAVFDCFFINGVAQFVVEGNQISGLDANGETVFSHSYSYVDELESMMTFSVYQSDDEDSGEFTYFLFAGDTPDETYHIEFRYGDDLEALGQLMEGKYAYWLAAGIRVETLERDAEASIRLFCEENLAEMAQEEEAAQ